MATPPLYGSDQCKEITKLSALKSAADAAWFEYQKTKDRRARAIAHSLRAAYCSAYFELTEDRRHLADTLPRIDTKPHRRGSLLPKLVTESDVVTVRSSSTRWKAERYRVARARQYFSELVNLWSDSVHEQSALENDMQITGEYIAGLRSKADWNFLMLAMCGVLFLLHLPVRRRTEKLVAALDAHWPAITSVVESDARQGA